MGKMLLSLKNIYRLFAVQDFPVYSEAVFSEKNRRGLTLVKFWQTYLAEDFRTGQYGKMIWRSEGKRNRHISTVINRTGTRPAYGNYEEECVRLLTPRALKRQQELFVDFLKVREFSRKAFLWKLKAYLNCLEEDPYFDQELSRYFQSFYKSIEETGMDEERGLQYSAWMLTLLTVFALAGSRMGRLREQTCLASFSAETVEVEQLSEKRKKYIRFLTKQTGELGRSPLPSQHFFGREQELFELRQMALTGGHYLISGMGGIGKTELLRQLLRLCAEENLCDMAALISWENSMAMSFVAAFAETGHTDLNKNFKEILARIRLLENKRVLIFIDNIDHTAAKDQGVKELCSLPATIFATSRVRELPGFTTFEIKSLSAEAGSLIFRDHYGKILTKESQVALLQMLEHEGSRHPLTLRFLGRTAGSGNWSPEELRDRFMRGSALAFREEKAASVFLRQVYERVYQLDHLSGKDRQVLDIYTRLPYRAYSGSFLWKYFMEQTESAAQIERRLGMLCWQGFLEKSENGFSMHPFIAECLENRGPGRKECFFERVLEQMTALLEGTEGQGETCPDVLTKYLEGGMLADAFAKVPQIGEICRILLYYEKKMQTGRRSRRQIGILLLAIEAVGRIYGFSGDMFRRLARFRQEYPDLPFAWRLRCLILEAYDLRASAEEYEQIFAELEADAANAGQGKELAEYFYVAYIRTLIHDGKFNKALEQCRVFWEKIQDAGLKLEISRYIIKILLEKNDFEEIPCWIKRSESLLPPEPDAEMVREVLMQKGRYYFFTEQWEMFRKAQEELCAGIGEEDILWQYQFFYWRGMAELTRAQDESAVASLEAAREYARAYYGENHTETAYVSYALGFSLCRMEQYEKALFYTEEALSIYERYTATKGMVRRAKNNVGHLKMKMGKLAEARVYLTEVYGELISDIENRDIPITAQVCDNLARIFHELGDREEERRWLTEAVGYMEQAFGTEHEMTREAKERLQLLRTE
ncbi:tetratricopeptide repeat protein [Marvinbryantia sp.]|uniref:tetratricopeptide repeat protein n=1 Tax=Marvinbryantia sp. TaxID=2496532 RepID=UPI003A8CA742